MARKRKKKKPAKIVLPDRHNWITVQRQDLSPAFDLYHMVAPSSAIKMLPERNQPLVGIPFGEKMIFQYPMRFQPSIKEALDMDMHNSAHVWVWRIPRRHYSSEKEFLAEAMAAGEVVCWIAGDEWRDKLIKRYYNPSWVVVAIETGIERGTLDICRCVAAFKPEWVAFVPSDTYPAKHLKRVHNYGAKTGDFFKVCDVTLIVEPGGNRFMPMSSKPLDYGYDK